VVCGFKSLTIFLAVLSLSAHIIRKTEAYKRIRHYIIYNPILRVKDRYYPKNE